MAALSIFFFNSKYRAALAHFLKEFFMFLGCPLQKNLNRTLLREKLSNLP